MEPGLEFKALESQALSAYVNQDYPGAEQLAQQAIQNNPEMFSAWALLSRIYEAQGEEQRAIAALFNGAHTRPKDPNTWVNVAEEILHLATDRVKALNVAIYCYNRVVSADRHSIAMRQRRAELYAEAGKHKRVVFEYRNLLRMVPHNLAFLQVLAHATTQHGTPSQAISYYDDAIAHYRQLRPSMPDSFSWSDANVYADLHLIAGDQIKHGLLRIKQLARWIQGRASEVFWDEGPDDDREFDDQSTPRRQTFLSSHCLEARSDAVQLPLELRVKLGLFRLELEDHDEAMVSRDK